MVLLYLNDKQKEKISLLNKFEADIIAEFCRISNESIYKEISPKVFNTAAQKLGLEVQDLKDLIELLTWIFFECSRLDLKEKEVNESLVLSGLKPELIAEVEQNINSNLKQIRTNLTGMRLNTVEYSNLEWRVDLNLASRSIRETVEPEIILKLDLKKSDQDEATTTTTTSEILKTDVVNLVHLTNSLEDALNEIKTHYVRRVMKNIV